MKKIAATLFIFFCLSINLTAQTSDPFTATQPENITLEELFLGIANVPVEYFEEVIRTTTDPQMLLTVVEVLKANSSEKATALLIEIANLGVTNVMTENGVIVNDWWDVKVMALIALGSRKATEAAPSIVNILVTTNDPIVKTYAALALGQIGDKSVVDLLISELSQVQYKLKSENLPYLYALVKALGDLKDTKAIPILLQVSTGPYPSFIKQTAVVALKGMS